MRRNVEPPIAVLSAAERKRLSEDIYYLNIAELQRFCEAHSIPYQIFVERPDGRIVRTRDTDRKGIVIHRILHFIHTGVIKPETIFCKLVIAAKRSRHPPEESDPVLYGSYKNHDQDILKLMKQLTAGTFEFGAVAQEVLRACWSRNEPPTYRDFARLWQKATLEHSSPNPEWAFLSDLARGSAGPDWRRLRAQKAAAVIAILKKII